ncbi:recombination protein NinB [Novosphingobium sp. Leaf2]|uniref:recombination protein NinB n=1 Tax=Novosphingobium sp. Leaf2 TaxID=1735670 RepID=UPI0006F3C141|nr:recombination protein NinB [Novosphingobium sp. Leaf2]KQM18413.1 hypothetical protein ASE49_09385 [Novosphingobium sp. Leaf2]
MNGQTIILSNPANRIRAHRLIEAAPDRAVLNVREANRSSDQNAKLWAMLSDVARAKPGGRVLTTENWKCLFMNAAGFNCTFVPALDGTGVVPLGFKSSRLNKAEFSDLIEAIYQFGAQHGVEWTDPAERKAA